jgi:hypothetical protein
MWGSCVLFPPTMPLMSAARVVQCLAIIPVGWPGYPCVKASRMARYLRRLSLIACSFWTGCSLQREYTMSQPLEYSFQKDLAKVSGRESRKSAIIASIRILVEHVIASVKRCRIVHDVFRNTTAHFDDLVMEIACGLHNFRATLRYAV